MLGKPIPKKTRERMAADPFYQVCFREAILHDHVCREDPQTGRLIEWEHALYHAGKKVNEWWAIIPSCWWAHRGNGLNKQINVWLAVNRIPEEDLRKYPNNDWMQQKKFLNKKYGVPDLSTGSAPF